MDVRIVEVDASALGSASVGLADVHARRVEGILVRGAYSPEQMASVAARLEAGVEGFSRLPMGVTFEAYSMGRGLDRSEREEYLSSVPGFREAASALFADVGDLDQRFADVLGALAGDREVRGPDDCGRPYMPFNFRCLPPGGTIPPHIELEQLTRKPYAHLGPLLDRVTLISFYLTIQPPEEGGLVLHDISWEDIDDSRMAHGHTQLGPLVAERDQLLLAQEAGDIVIFDGGRIAHHVAPVGGSRNRWTVGGFLSMSADGSHWWRWA